MESVCSEDNKLNEGNKTNEDGMIGGISDQKKKKVPRRVLHFSDGVLEEYSTDEDDQKNKDEVDFVKKSANNQLLTSDPKTMFWSTWFWYHIVIAGSSTLSVCDYLGEKLAAFFGITSPKYEYEIDYYNSMKAEEEERKKRQDLEMGGWTGDQQNKVFNSSDKAVDPHNVITSKERY